MERDIFKVAKEAEFISSDTDKMIQGYSSGVFWERNTLNLQMAEQKKGTNIREWFMDINLQSPLDYKEPIK